MRISVARCLANRSVGMLARISVPPGDIKDGQRGIGVRSLNGRFCTTRSHPLQHAPRLPCLLKLEPPRDENLWTGGVDDDRFLPSDGSATKTNAALLKAVDHDVVAFVIVLAYVRK